MSQFIHRKTQGVVRFGEKGFSPGRTPPPYRIYMESMSARWKDIIKLKGEHGTLYMRVPRYWAVRHGLTSRDCVIVRRDEQDRLVVNSLDRELKNGTGIERD